MRRWLPLFGLCMVWLALRALLLTFGAELGEARSLSIDGHRVSALYVHGEHPAETLLVVTHGGLSSKESVLPLCWEARRRGADCIAVDALGHGTSSTQPAVDTIERSAAALRVDRVLDVHYARVRFIGHSMGAYLGRGLAFPCSASYALGQGTRCEDDRVVWGTFHLTVGLSDRWYLLAHVLESWTPWVVRTAVDGVLGPAKELGHVGGLIALAWLSFVVAGAAGVVAARQVRAKEALPPVVRGVLGAAALWLGLTLGGWRALWWLLPTQFSDLVLVATVVLLAVVLTRSLGGRGGLFFGVTSTLGAALWCWFVYHQREMGTLMLLLPAMTVPLVPWVVVWHRWSSVREDGVETAAFTATTLSLFVALLLPGF